MYSFQWHIFLVFIPIACRMIKRFSGFFGLSFVLSGLYLWSYEISLN